MAVKHSVHSRVKLIVSQPKTKFFEETEPKLEKIKKLGLDNIARKVCTKLGEAKLN